MNKQRTAKGRRNEDQMKTIQRRKKGRETGTNFESKTNARLTPAREATRMMAIYRPKGW